MRPIFFTADHHFGHRNIIQHDNRPFRDVQEMDAEMIRRWNAVVPVGADVYHLGDLTMHLWPYAENILHQLNGHVFIVPGNHDKAWLKKAARLHTNGLSILEPIHELQLPGCSTMVLCHYPMCSWNCNSYGVWHLHGHCHGTLREWHPRRLDLWVGMSDYTPMSLEEVVERISAQQRRVVNL